MSSGPAVAERFVGGCSLAGRPRVGSSQPIWRNLNAPVAVLTVEADGVTLGMREPLSRLLRSRTWRASQHHLVTRSDGVRGVAIESPAAAGWTIFWCAHPEGVAAALEQAESAREEENFVSAGHFGVNATIGLLAFSAACALIGVITLSRGDATSGIAISVFAALVTLVGAASLVALLWGRRRFR